MRLALPALAIAAAASLTTLAVAHPPHLHPPADTAGDSAEADARNHETIAFFEERLVTEPNDLVAISRLSMAYLERARSRGAHSEFARAEAMSGRWIDKRPASDAARKGLAVCLIGQHRFGDALEQARAAARIAPDDPETWGLLGDAHFAIGNDAEAEAFYRRLVEHELTLESLARWAMMLQHRGRLQEADDAWHEALDAGRLLDRPAAVLAWCHTMIGEFDLLILGNPDAATAHFRAALELDPSAHAAVWRMAEIDLSRGDFGSARDRLQPIAERFGRPAYWTALGDALAGLGEDADASRWLELAERTMVSEVDRGDYGHARELVEFWLAHDGDGQRAVELALRDLEDVRQDARAFETAAWALHRVGRHDEAAGLIASAVRRSSADPRTLWRAGKILDAAGRTAEADVLLGRARAQNAVIDDLVATSGSGR